MDKLNRIKGVIFDMDGVLCDSEPYLYRAAREMFLSRHGIEVKREDFAPFVGTGENRYLGGVAENYGIHLRMPEDKNATYEIYLDLIAGELEALPGVTAFIRKCRQAGLKMAVATSADRIKMEGNLVQIGLPPEQFEALINGNDVVNKKPNPEIFDAAIRALSLDPPQCLIIEDSPSGVEAAKRSGSLCLGVLSTFREDELRAKGADWTVRTMEDLPAELVGSLFGTGVAPRRR